MNEKLVYDPGHGGPDDGAVYGAAEEDDLNLSIANLCFYMSQLKGFKVDITRDRDEKVELWERTDISNDIRPDAFISIHCDAFHKKTVNGMTVHVHPRASKTSRRLAQNVMASMAETFQNLRNRGVKESDFHVLRETNEPAILIECGFLSNSKERKFLQEPHNQHDMAGAIVRGVQKTFKK